MFRGPLPHPSRGPFAGARLAGEGAGVVFSGSVTLMPAAGMLSTRWIAGKGDCSLRRRHGRQNEALVAARRALKGCCSSKLRMTCTRSRQIV